MNSFQIETWAVSVIENVLHGKPNEDARVELKASWPEDHRKAARNIAAHANVARGDSILWIIGVDQKNQSVIGVKHEELSTWYEKVRSYFDERIAPSPIDININTDGKTIVALCFDTDRFPYVVKQSNELLEIPWREATFTRSANRLELLKLLSPLQSVPMIEFLNGTVSLISARDEKFQWSYNLNLYIEPTGFSPLIIPYHRCSATIEIIGLSYIKEINSIRLSTPHMPYRFGSRAYGSENLSKTIEPSADEIIINGPGRLVLNSFVAMDKEMIEIGTNQPLRFSLSLFPTYSAIPTRVEAVLDQTTDYEPEKNPEIFAYWKLSK